MKVIKKPDDDISEKVNSTELLSPQKEIEEPRYMQSTFSSIIRVRDTLNKRFNYSDKIISEQKQCFNRRVFR